MPLLIRDTQKSSINSPIWKVQCYSSDYFHFQSVTKKYIEKKRWMYKRGKKISPFIEELNISEGEVPPKVESKCGSVQEQDCSYKWLGWVSSAGWLDSTSEMERQFSHLDRPGVELLLPRSEWSPSKGFQASGLNSFLGWCSAYVQLGWGPGHCWLTWDFLSRTPGKLEKVWASPNTD